MFTIPSSVIGHVWGKTILHSNMQGMEQFLLLCLLLSLVSTKAGLLKGCLQGEEIEMFDFNERSMGNT